ncbi:glycosyltransferase family 2 protein [Parapedobacter sp. 10938]|uniref:glycosyltransferase family 2 protein n=1 Tax=Parapedobacter flavus TaxID=3110225 RepID=UPI002DBC79E6|nr:glycosyltransferase [Parapedobacter sp. 10938]MEC3878252.1 glycosyltransferase [Parapedobacter sp. 10938]
MPNKFAKQRSPRVSVLMSAYNAERYVGDAIQSILDQSFKDFELIIFNDGSTDSTASIVRQYSDPRIRFMDNSVNKGLVYARRTTLEAAVGEYVAILDSDDIAMSGRLAQQYDFIEKYPNVVLCGGNAVLIDEEGKSTGKLLHPAYRASELKARFFWSNILVNSSVMFRREQAVAIGGYRDMAPVEDYDLFVRLADQYSIHVFNEPLVYYRIHGQNISQTKYDKAIEYLRIIKDQQLQLLGADPDMLGAVFDALLWRRFTDHATDDFFTLLMQLKSANRLSGKLPIRFFEKELFNRWYDVVTATIPKSRAASYLLRKGLFKVSFTSFKQKRRIFKFWLRLLIN